MARFIKAIVSTKFGHSKTAYKLAWLHYFILFPSKLISDSQPDFQPPWPLLYNVATNLNGTVC